MCLMPRTDIRLLAALLLLMCTLGTAQTKPDKNTKHDAAVDALRVAMETARLKPYLDKDGGYKDKDGGYYNPKAGTYTDKEGGVVDNWKGYTYKDGSYKSGLGDFWDAKTKTFKLTTGEVMKSNDTTSEEAIKMLRETVEEQHGDDKYFTVKSMIQAIKNEHPETNETQKHP